MPGGLIKALAALGAAKTVVPPLWHTEVANALLVGERRRVVTEAQVIDYLNRLYRLPIVTDDAVPASQPASQPASRQEMVLSLGHERGLSAYDATYLDLTLRTGSILATFDGKLVEAMRRAGGRVFGDV